MQLREPDRTERVPVDLAAEVIAGGRSISARVVSLSLQGGFLETDQELAPGTRLELHLALPPSKTLVLQATAVREGMSSKPVDHPDVDTLSVATSGVGLTFDALDEADAARLRACLTEWLDR